MLSLSGLPDRLPPEPVEPNVQQGARVRRHAETFKNQNSVFRPGLPLGELR
jgi:hypothetical protein